MTEHSARSSAAQILYSLLLVAPLCLTPRLRANSLDYGISINTASLPFDSNGLFFAGLDLQFDPGILSNTQEAEAYNTAFNFCCSFFGSSTTGDASAAPPPDYGGAIFDNRTPYNDFFSQLLVSNTGINFELTFSGPAIDTPDPSTFPSGSSFGISLYDGAGVIPYLTSDPNGFLAILTLNADGTISTKTFSNANGGSSAITVTNLDAPPPPPPVPEPNTFMLFATGLIGAISFIRRRTLRD
jgi:hypothetical protein